MENHNSFDVIIVGGSYSGLAACMALGRSLRQVLIIKMAWPHWIAFPNKSRYSD